MKQTKNKLKKSRDENRKTDSNSFLKRSIEKDEFQLLEGEKALENKRRELIKKKSRLKKPKKNHEKPLSKMDIKTKSKELERKRQQREQEKSGFNGMLKERHSVLSARTEEAEKKFNEDPSLMNRENYQEYQNELKMYERNHPGIFKKPIQNKEDRPAKRSRLTDRAPHP